MYHKYASISGMSKENSSWWNINLKSVVNRLTNYLEVNNSNVVFTDVIITSVKTTLLNYHIFF